MVPNLLFSGDWQEYFNLTPCKLENFLQFLILTGVSGSQVTLGTRPTLNSETSNSVVYSGVFTGSGQTP